MKDFIEFPIRVTRVLGKNTLFYEYEQMFNNYEFINNNDVIKDLNVKAYPDFFNDYGFRSDTFTKSHIGKHILFSGCSVTSGVGLLRDEIWSHLLYNKIKDIDNVSGFYNLAIQGTSSYVAISNLFKYFNIYGNPDIIFLNIPSLLRFYGFTLDKNNILESIYEDESFDLLKVVAFQYYSMLEQYCKSNNIQLYSFSWHEKTQTFMSNNLETFYSFNHNDLNNFLYEYKNKNDDIFYEKARDNQHYGTAYHQYWANFMFDNYIRKNND